MIYKFIDHTDPLIERVIDLGKKNSATLGLMPRDAYIEQARKRCLLVASEDDNLVGYCLFRLTTSKMRIGITQVCVSPDFRRQKVAQTLLNVIRDKYKNVFGGMLISCREDYIEPCALWSRYGFTRAKRVRSRSLEERYLIKFWYNFGVDDLFSQASSTELKAAIDLNIIIKLRDDHPDDFEVKQLMADWLTDEVEYYYTKESLTEIHRDGDHARTNKTLKFLRTFQELNSDISQCEGYMPQLKQLHPGNTDNHVSDRRQIAECKAAKLTYFITTDEGIIDNRDALFEALGVTVLRPAEFILEIDELKNQRLYEPLRLQGARYDVKRIDSSELNSAVDFFLNKDKGERKIEFQSVVTRTAADTISSYVKVVHSPDNEKVATFGATHLNDRIEIPFLRVKSSSLSNTLFNQILIEVIRDAVAQSKSKVEVHEHNLNNDQKQILQSNGFYANGNRKWIKMALSGVFNLSALEKLNGDINANHEISKLIALLRGQTEQDLMNNLKLQLERSLWPAKFEDLDLPCYIVPVKPVWAAQLFDYMSSQWTLFGSAPALSWSKENVYYKSANQRFGQFPGRILWYASEERGFERQKSIVGCSYLNNVLIGEAKQLFSTFRRYGIYQWSDISKMVDGNIHAPIQVLQFGDTEVFKTPIPLNKIREVLAEENLSQQTFVSRVKIPSRTFIKFYKLAYNLP